MNPLPVLGTLCAKRGVVRISRKDNKRIILHLEWPTKRPEPVSHGSSDPMSEPVSRARGDTLDARYIECARPTGGSHGLTIDDATQRFKGAKRRPRQGGGTTVNY